MDAQLVEQFVDTVAKPAALALFVWLVSLVRYWINVQTAGWRQRMLELALDEIVQAVEQMNGPGGGARKMEKAEKLAVDRVPGVSRVDFEAAVYRMNAMRAESDDR